MNLPFRAKLSEFATFRELCSRLCDFSRALLTTLRLFASFAYDFATFLYDFVAIKSYRNLTSLFGNPPRRNNTEVAGSSIIVVGASVGGVSVPRLSISSAFRNR